MYYIKDPRNKFIDELIKTIKSRPDTFTCDAHNFKDTLSSLEVWVASGISFISIEKPYKIELSFRQKVRLTNAIGRWKCQDAIRMMEQGQVDRVCDALEDKREKPSPIKDTPIASVWSDKLLNKFAGDCATGTVKTKELSQEEQMLRKLII